MNSNKQNLKNVIDNFLSQSTKTLQLGKDNEENLNEDEIKTLAEKIWELRHFSIELLECYPDESTQYNASIIKEVVEQPIVLEDRKKPKISLVQAADAAKKNNDLRPLTLIIKALNQKPTYSETFFEDLKQISLELAA